jgi:hypothetical protein
LTSREIEEGILKLEEKKKAVEEKKAQAEEPVNCTAPMIEPESLTTKQGGVSGLQGMGVFTLCGLLATLGWGGIASILVVAAKAWATKPPNKGMDSSTSTGELVGSDAARPLKSAMLSFMDERARWEWPRRTVPLGRRARRARACGIP